MVEKTNPSESAAAAEKCEMSNNQVSGITEIPGCCRADITRAHFPPAEDKCVKVQKRGGGCSSTLVYLPDILLLGPSRKECNMAVIPLALVSKKAK